MNGYITGVKVRDKILEQGMQASEATAYFWGNVIKGVQDTSKGALSLDSSKRAATGVFKASTDFARGDALCGSLCSLSTGCELVSGVLVWLPIPGKVVTITALKATSIGCQKFRDLCAANPSSPLC